jgi:hypothetical protein
MSQEKKPRKVGAKKAVTKNSTETPVVAMAAPVALAPTSKAPAARKSTPTKAAKTKAKSLQVSLDDIIRLRAYEIYLQRGATPGNPHEDWNVAEREVRAHFGQNADSQEADA